MYGDSKTLLEKLENKRVLSLSHMFGNKEKTWTTWLMPIVKIKEKRRGITIIAFVIGDWEDGN